MKKKYFMGVSTGCGFKTEFYNEHKDYYGYFIKGGPGTGKSTMMKRIAEEFSKENISVYSCSSDPDSVDAIVFEDKHIYFADATPPHESNPKLPFVTGEIIDLATGLDASKLNEVKEEAVYLNNQNKACHNTVKKYLSVIGEIQDKIIEIGKEYANTFPITTIVRGEANESVENELVTLFENVTNDEKLNATIIRLSFLWKKAKLDTYNDYTDYAPYIGWYLAIAYLEDYDKDKAKDVLKDMEEMYPVGTAIGDKVRNLLKEI